MQCTLQAGNAISLHCFAHSFGALSSLVQRPEWLRTLSGCLLDPDEVLCYIIGPDQEGLKSKTSPFITQMIVV